MTTEKAISLRAVVHFGGILHSPQEGALVTSVMLSDLRETHVKVEQQCHEEF